MVEKNILRRKSRAKPMIAVMTAMALLAGCQKTPEAVQKNMSEYGKDTQMEEKELSFCTIDELQKKTLPQPKGRNLTFPENVRFSDIEEVDLFDLNIHKNFMTKENTDKYFNLFHIKKDTPVKMVDYEAFGKMALYENSSGQYFTIGENGGLVCILGEDNDNLSDMKKPETWKREEDVFSKISFLLGDKKENLQEYCKKKQKWLDQNMGGEGITYRITNVDRFEEKKSKRDLIGFSASYAYKGIPFNDRLDLSVDDDSFVTHNILNPFFSIGLFDDKDHLSFFSRNCFFEIQSPKKVDKVITPECAAGIVEEKMSGFGILHIEQAFPMYALFCKDTTGLFQKTGAEYEARPVYAFAVNKSAAEYEQNDITIPSNGIKHFFLVDMVTGEFTTDMDTEAVLKKLPRKSGGGS